MRKGNSSGFSLVEVVLALGISVFAMVTILGLFASFVESDQDIAERRELIEAIDPLNNYLENEVKFNNVFAWFMGGARKELYYVTYRVDQNGDPDAEGDEVISTWLDPTIPTSGSPSAPSNNPDDYKVSREGYWVRARINISPANPTTANVVENSTTTTYPHAYLVLEVELESLPPDPAVVMPAEARLTVPMTILR